MNVSRAPYAEDARRSRGRLHSEPESLSRNAFRRDADRIIVIKDGEAVESGTHDELVLKENGVYRTLSELQFDLH